MHLTARLIILLFISSTATAGTLKRGFGPEPDSLDIHQAQGLSAIHLLRETREGLFTFDVAGEPAPGVAQEWVVSPDGLSWTFRLRPDARWSNGDIVVAHDFVRGWHRALSPESVARNAALLSDVAGAGPVMAGLAGPETLGIRALDEHTLEVRLTRRVPWFREILAHPVTYPLHAEMIEDPRRSPVNGAFTIAHSVPHAVIELAPNPYFHSADSVRPDVVELFPIEDPAAELSRFRAGELHITESIPSGRYDWLVENHPGELRVSPYLGSFWLGFNLSRPPFEGNPELRRALSAAIDRDVLVRVITGAGELPAWGIVPPGLEGYESIRPPGTNQREREEQARTLFRKAGYTRNSAPHVELRFNSSSQHRRMAVAVSAMWKQVLGVTTTLINEEWKVFVNNRSQRVRTQVFRGGWIADYADPASFLDLFLSSEALNWSAWSSADYDRLLDDAAGQVAGQRMETLKQAETLLLRDMPVIPLYYYVSRHLVAPEVQGFVDNVRDIHLSRYMSTRQTPR